MRKRLITAGVIAAIVALLVLLAGSGEGGGYVVRAIFENGSFMVHGEQVRIAGATVGEIESVGVTMPGEIDSYEHGRPQAVPGKAVLVMRITNPGFQDFRADGGCLIRPQSLIGEKFVDCRPTLPRAPGSPIPPPLKKIPSGQPGAGQYLLPLENNSASVDPDLINNIQQLPYAQRFRLILNELGAGLAGRGKDLETIIQRANPTLRDVDRLIGILAAQRHELAQLAANSEQILRPLSQQRSQMAGFFASSGAAAEASAERGAALEASLQKFPRFLIEFRQTMTSLKHFSDAAAPVFAELGKAAPSLTEATRDLAPFTAASTVSLKSLGASGEVAGPRFREADPLIRKVRDLAKSGAGTTNELAGFLNNVKQTKGFDALMELIYNSTGAVNEFDQYGHFVRSLVDITNCTEYEVAPTPSCHAFFEGGAEASSLSGVALDRYLAQRLAQEREGGRPQPRATVGGAITAPEEAAAEGEAPPSRGSAAPSIGEGHRLGAAAPTSRPRRALLNYLLAP